MSVSPRPPPAEPARVVRRAGPLGNHLGLRGRALDVPGQPHRQQHHDADGRHRRRQPDWYADFLRSFGHGSPAPASGWRHLRRPLTAHRPRAVGQPARLRVIGLGIGLALLYWITDQGIGELLTGWGPTEQRAAHRPHRPRPASTVPDPADAPVPAARLFALHRWPPPWRSSPSPSFRRPSPSFRPPLRPPRPCRPCRPAPLPPQRVDEHRVELVHGHVRHVDVGRQRLVDRAGRRVGVGLVEGIGVEGIGSKTANSMNMSGMAGLGITDPNWKYTGPPLPPPRCGC